MNDEARLPESPFDLERLMRESARRFENEEYESEDAFRESMEEDLAETRSEHLKNDPAEMAQELAFRAFESDDPKTAVKLAEEALQQDPECVDALTIHAFLTSEDAAELIDRIEHAATCGETKLGEDFFSEFLGDFWQMVEARPYMRTIKQLAQVLWLVGRRFDAVENYENLLELDPSDHMGNASLLLGCYLSMGEVQRSWDLLEEYDDESALFQWAWTLVFLMAQDEDAAEDALGHALEMNIGVVPHLLGMVEDAGEPGLAVPEPGSDEEAIVCGLILGGAWRSQEESMLWLQHQLLERGVIELDDEDGEDGDD